jgi:phage terminase small subunit
VLEETARCAMYDVRRLFYPDGNPKPLSELDDDIAAAIVSLGVSITTNDQGETMRVMKYRLVPKDQALDKLMRHLGLYAQDNKQPRP